MQQRVGEDVGVDFHGVLDFIAAAAAAAFGVGTVVEAVWRVEQDNLALERDPTENGNAGGFRQFEVLDRENRAENLVIQWDVLEAVVAEDRLDLAFKCLAPRLVRARRRGEQKAAVFEVFLEVIAFFGGQIEILLAGHDHERDFEKFIVSEFDRFEPALGGDRRFLLDGGEEFIAEALGGFGASVDQIATLDGTFFAPKRQRKS